MKAIIFSVSQSGVMECLKYFADQSSGKEDPETSIIPAGKKAYDEAKMGNFVPALDFMCTIYSNAKSFQDPEQDNCRAINLRLAFFLGGFFYSR
jgi:hypothetical protein